MNDSTTDRPVHALMLLRLNRAALAVAVAIGIIVICVLAFSARDFVLRAADAVRGIT